MTSEQKYQKAFCESLAIEADQNCEALEYNQIPEWDSIGHMTMIAALEDEFEISMETDDIVNFSSYKKGREILGKYGVAFS